MSVISDSIKRFWLKNLKSYFLVCFIYVFSFKNERFAHSLFFGERCERFAHSLFFSERCERIAQVAHQKWLTMSESLKSLIFFAKNKRFAQKTDERIPSPVLDGYVGCWTSANRNIIPAFIFIYKIHTYYSVRTVCRVIWGVEHPSIEIV